MVKKSSVSQGKVYVVEDILDTRVINGLQHYRVKWKGYSFSECTWEPQQSFNCSRQILNLFLMARAQKQPSFKEKLQKITKQKDLTPKTKDNTNEESTEKILVKHNEAKRSLGKNEKETEVKKQKEPNSQGDQDIKYGIQFQTKTKSKNDSKQNLQPTKAIKQELSIIKKTPNENHQVKIQANEIPQRQSLPRQKKIDKHKTDQIIGSKSQQKNLQTFEKKDNVVTRNNGLRQNNLKLSETQFRILSVKQKENSFIYTVLEEGKKLVKTREEMHQKYALQLCQYYERFITFDD